MREWKPGDTRLDGRKWRVRRWEVEVPKTPRFVPPAKPFGPPWDHPTKKVRVWGIWPPLWPLSGEPLLVFPVWLQAVNAAWSRAQFHAAPPPPNSVGSQGFREEA